MSEMNFDSNDPRSMIYDLWLSSDAHQRGTWEEFWADYGEYFSEFDTRGAESILSQANYSIDKNYAEGISQVEKIGRNIGRSGFKTGVRRNPINTSGTLRQLEASGLRSSAMSAIDSLRKDWEDTTLSMSMDLTREGAYEGKQHFKQKPWYAGITPWNDASYDPFDGDIWS